MSVIIEKDFNNEEYVRILYSNAIKINKEFFMLYLDKLTDKSLRLFLNLIMNAEMHSNYITDNHGNSLKVKDSEELRQLINLNLINSTESGFYVVNPFIVGIGGDVEDE